MIQNRKHQVSLIIASGAVRFPFVAPFRPPPFWVGAEEAKICGYPLTPCCLARMVLILSLFTPSDDCELFAPGTGSTVHPKDTYLNCETLHP